MGKIFYKMDHECGRRGSLSLVYSVKGPQMCEGFKMATVHGVAYVALLADICLYHLILCLLHVFYWMH